MPEKYIEKSFLYLILLSALFHAATFGLISLIPPEPQSVEKVTMVELKDLPETPPPAKPKPKPEPRPMVKVEPKPLLKPVPLPVPPVRRLRALPPEVALPQVPKETAPKADHRPERIAETKSDSKAAGKAEPNQQDATSIGKPNSVFRTSEKGGQETVRGTKKIELAKLFPSAKKMSSLEETYREKYRGSEQGDTRLMNTSDPLVAVFSSRMLAAANASLAIESRKRPLEGKDAIGVLLITINREGVIENVEMIETTKNAPLDRLFIDSIYKSGYVGPLPKKWPHEKLKFIWFAISRAPEMAP